MVKVLVTGSEGFIGSNLVHLLSERNFEVVPFDKRFNLDITDEGDLRGFMKGCDYVYNFAAISGIDACLDDPELAYEVNVVGARTVVEVATRLKCKPILFSSFAAKGLTLYGETKREMEKENEKEAVILRMANVFGGLNYKTLKPNNFISRISTDRPIRIFEGVGTRDFVHMKFVLDWCLKAMEKPFGIYEVATGYQVPIETVALIASVIRDVEVKYE